MKMKDLINREEALKVLCEFCKNDGCQHGLRPRCDRYIAMKEIRAEISLPDISPIQEYALDPGWQKVHHEMGFASPLYDVYEALGVYSSEAAEGAP